MVRSRWRPLSPKLTIWALAWVAALVRDVENGLFLAVLTCLLGTLKILWFYILNCVHKEIRCVRYFLWPQIIEVLTEMLRQWEWGFLSVLFLCESVLFICESIYSAWDFVRHCCMHEQQQTLNFGCCDKQCVIECNPAFGGRGTGLRRKCKTQRNETVRKLKQCEKLLQSFSDKTFDSTLGYPGEGWARFSMATWNTRSLTFERLKYCESLGYDVLAITELWRNQNKYCN